MGVNRFPEPTPADWYVQSTYSIPIDLGDNNFGTINSGASANTGNVAFTVPNFGRGEVSCIFQGYSNMHVQTNAAGFLYVYVDDVETCGFRWHTSGTTFNGMMVTPIGLRRLTPGSHNVKLTATSEAAASFWTYGRVSVCFLG